MEYKFVDNFFKVISLLFWPIVWYKWIVLTNTTIESILVYSYTLLTILFIISSILYIKIKKLHTEKIEFLYVYSTLLAYVSTLYSFLLFPKNITLFYLKTILTLILLYFSGVKLLRYKKEEGVVGIIASLLLIAINILY